MQRVKYYPQNDHACGVYLQKIEKLEKMPNFNQKVFTINDSIELYNIRKYFDVHILLKHWNENDFNKYDAFSKQFNGICFKFFNNLTDENIIENVTTLEIIYIDDFWKIFEKCKIYTKISKDKFVQLLNNEKVSIYDILEQQKTVSYYGNELRNFIVASKNGAEVLISKFTLQNQDQVLFIPSELNDEDKENILLSYIQSDYPQLNLLDSIITIQSTPELKISDQIKKKAKQRRKIEVDKLFEKQNILSQIIIGFSPNLADEKVFNYTSNNGEFKTEITYSLKWIEENLDYPTIMNNFIYLFEFVDLQMRITLVNKESEASILEALMYRLIKTYKKGFIFDFRAQLALMQIMGYYNILDKNNICFEKIIEWFFKEYLKNEFNINGFRITMPSINLPYREKCMLILPTLESIIKQFSCYVQEGKIDFELLQIGSNPLIYKEIPSLIEKKYVYGCGDNFKTLTHFMFSDQCMLSFVSRLDKKYKSFYELISEESINDNDYNEINLEKIRWLQNNNIIEVSINGNIQIKDKKMVTILKDLYENEVINNNHYSIELRTKIIELEKIGIIRYGKSLLSEPEVFYFNYYMNKSMFDNSLDLRNRYIHGNQLITDDEEEHKRNYFIFLILLILLVIKINDEFCLKEKLKYEESLNPNIAN